MSPKSPAQFINLALNSAFHLLTSSSRIHRITDSMSATTPRTSMDLDGLATRFANRTSKMTYALDKFPDNQSMVTGSLEESIKAAVSYLVTV